MTPVLPPPCSCLAPRTFPSSLSRPHPPITSPNTPWISQGSPGNRTKSMDADIHKEIHYEGLAHAMVEDEKPHDLRSASWGPRKAGV